MFLVPIISILVLKKTLSRSDPSDHHSHLTETRCLQLKHYGKQLRGKRKRGKASLSSHSVVWRIVLSCATHTYRIFAGKMRSQILAVVTVIILWQLHHTFAKPKKKFYFWEPKQSLSKKYRLNYCDDCSKLLRLSKKRPYFKFNGIDYRYARVSSYPHIFMQWCNKYPRKVNVTSQNDF